MTDIIIKNKKRENMHTDRCGNASGQKCHAKGSRKKEEFMYRNKRNVGHEMYAYTGNNWSQRNSNKGLKKNLKTMPGKYSIDSLQKTVILGK
jgi:hypothetical protein